MLLLIKNECILNVSQLKLNTLEKQAPICTLGVGGRPLLIGFGGELRCFDRRGGTGGVSANKSGSGPSPI